MSTPTPKPKRRRAPAGAGTSPPPAPPPPLPTPREPIEVRIRRLQEAKGKADSVAPGLECPKCGCREFFVVYVRPRLLTIVRRRQCRHCGKRITTRERVT